MLKRNLIFAALVLAFSFTSLFAQNMDEGKKLLKNESFRKAIEIFNKINTPEAYYYLGEAYFHLEKYDSAKTAYQNGINADKDFGLNYAGLAKVNFKENNSAEAEKNIAKALEIADDKNIPIHQAVGEAYISSGKDNAMKAKDILEKAIKITPKKEKKDKRTYILLGDMYLTQNDGSKAVENYKRAVDLDSSAVALVGIGKIFSYIRNYGEAELSFNNAIRIDPSYPVAYKELAELKYNLKQYDQAIEYWKKYMSMTEDSPENERRLATIIYLSKDYKTAAQMITNYLQQDPNNANMQHLLAYSYSLTDDYQNGIPAFQKYFQMAKKEDLVSSDYEYYAKLLTASGNDSLAAEQLQNALNLDSTRTDLYSNLLQTYSKLKKPEMVISLVQSKKTPLTALDYFEYGRALYTVKDYTKADSAFASFIALKPELPIGYVWRARSAANLDPETEKGLAKPYYEQALPILEKDSVKYKKELIEAYSYLGYYYYLQNDIPTMKQNWQKVLDLDPTNQQAIDAIKFKPGKTKGKK